jgi:DNA polymerase III gamma/tau subunit
VLGISRNERVEGIITSIADRDAAAGLTIIGEAVDAGEDVRQLAKQVLTYLRLLLLERAQGTADADEVAKSLAKRFELGDLADIARRFGDMDFRIKHAILPQLPLELALVDATLRGSAPVVQPARLEQPRTETAPPPAPAPVEQSEPAKPRTSLRDRVRQTGPSPRPARSDSPASEPIAAAPVTTPPAAKPVAAAPVATGDGSAAGIEMLIEMWPKIRADVKAMDRKAEAIMQQIDPVHIAGSKLTLTSAYEFHRNRMNSDEIRRVVEDVVSRLIGQTVEITCVSREDADRLRNQPQSSPRPASSTAKAPDPRPPREAVPAAAKPTPPVVPDTVIDPESERRITAIQNIFDAEEIT